MSRNLRSADLRLAAHVIEELEEMITAMKLLADQDEIAEIAIDGRKVRMQDLDPTDDSSYNAVVCEWTADECLTLLESAAKKCGVSLFDKEDLNVKLPPVEFEENLVTGHFEAWRGIKVKVENPMEDLLSLLSDKLSVQGILMEWDDSDVEAKIVFALPLKSSRSMYK